MYADKGRNPQLLLEMTDKDVVDKFRDVVGVGNVTDRTYGKSHWKPRYRWTMRKKDEVIRILSAMLPYFGNRRAYKALNILDDLEL